MSKSFTCDLNNCGATFRKSSDLRKHLVGHNDPSKILHCGHCSFTTLYPKSLKAHLTKHSDEEPLVSEDIKAVRTLDSDSSLKPSHSCETNTKRSRARQRVDASAQENSLTMSQTANPMSELTSSGGSGASHSLALHASSSDACLSGAPQNNHAYCSVSAQPFPLPPNNPATVSHYAHQFQNPSYGLIHGSPYNSTPSSQIQAGTPMAEMTHSEFVARHYSNSEFAGPHATFPPSHQIPISTRNHYYHNPNTVYYGEAPTNPTFAQESTYGTPMANHSITTLPFPTHSNTSNGFSAMSHQGSFYDMNNGSARDATLARSGLHWADLRSDMSYTLANWAALPSDGASSQALRSEVPSSANSFVSTDLTGPRYESYAQANQWAGPPSDVSSSQTPVSETQCSSNTIDNELDGFADTPNNVGRAVSLAAAPIPISSVILRDNHADDNGSSSRSDVAWHAGGPCSNNIDNELDGLYSDQMDDVENAGSPAAEPVHALPSAVPQDNHVATAESIHTTPMVTPQDDHADSNATLSTSASPLAMAPDLPEAPRQIDDANPWSATELDNCLLGLRATESDFDNIFFRGMGREGCLCPEMMVNAGVEGWDSSTLEELLGIY